MAVAILGHEMADVDLERADVACLRLFNKPLRELIENYERLGQHVPNDLLRTLVEIGYRLTPRP